MTGPMYAVIYGRSCAHVESLRVFHVPTPNRSLWMDS
jgi:hypothetical protein